ncbi:hypothetical protein HDU98_008225 [Podochytrium sp. JEL0797]|nr:hypothetical protein HDU98_008225 [Podochytrium sp. JEL0797]
MLDIPEDFPWKAVVLLLLTVMPEVMIHSMLSPTYPYMVKHLLPDEDRIGYYAGLLQSAYFMPTIVCAPVMGFLSDKYGRKPVLLAGLAGYGCGTMLLGLSTTFNASLFSLFFTGCFAGNTIVAKGMIGELTKDDRARALGYSWYGIVYGICGVLGAIMGGYLADPILFIGVPVLEQRPYLLACSLGVLTAATAGGIVYLMLEQTQAVEYNPVSKDAVDSKVMFDASITEEPIGQHTPSISSEGTRRRTSGQELDITDSVEMETMESALAARKEKHTLSEFDNEDDESEMGQHWNEDDSYRGDFYKNHIRPYLNLLTRKTIVPLSLYALCESHAEFFELSRTHNSILVALSNAVFLTALSLIAAAPISKGGYNLSQRVAFWSMGGYAAVKILVKGFYYKTNALFGTKWTYRLGVFVMVPAVLLVPARLGLNWNAYQSSLATLLSDSTNNTSVAVATPSLSAANGTIVAGLKEGVSLIARSFSSIGNKIHDGGYEVPVAGLVVLTSIMGFGDGLTYLSVVMVRRGSNQEAVY